MTADQIKDKLAKVAQERFLLQCKPWGVSIARDDDRLRDQEHALRRELAEMQA